jgi:predicted nucleotidyltransferase
VVPVRAGNGCPVDISLAVPGYEDEMMRRAVDYELEPGKVVRMASAEDLIIHKAVAGRPQDLQDIAGIVYRRRQALDVAYVRRWLREFASALEMPEILDRFEQAWGRIRP